MPRAVSAHPAAAPSPWWDGLLPMVIDERPLALDAPGWIWEIKHDGFRMLAHFGGGRCDLRTRQGADASAWFPELREPLAAVRGGPFIADGEVCVLDELGRTDFDALMTRARRKRWYAGARPVVYCAFDLLAVGPRNLMRLPLLDRKARLAQVLTPLPACTLLVGHFEDNADALWSAVQQLELEGLVAKRVDSIYTPGVLSRDWVKVKRKGAVPAQRFSRKVASDDTETREEP